MLKLTLGYCPVGNGDSIAPFDRVFKNKKCVTDGLDGVNAVVFWGGGDIHPSLYGQQRHKSSQAGHKPSSRDEFEWSLMKACKARRIPMIGVCRGAQLMCAFEGGTLVQDCDNHAFGTHDINTTTGEGFTVTSAHHQMLNLEGTSYKLLGWANPHLSTYYEDDKGNVERMKHCPEPEIVYFPACNGLAIQGHPEWAVNTPFADLCNRLIEEYLLEKVEA